MDGKLSKGQLFLRYNDARTDRMQVERALYLIKNNKDNSNL